MAENGPYVIAEYIWLGGNNELRSKTRIVYNIKTANPEGFPNWNYDGSSTDQADGLNSELNLKPVAVYRNPFGHPCGYSNSFLVLCETYDKYDKPLSGNNRHFANVVFNSDMGKSEKPWFGIEQEYFIIGKKHPFQVLHALKEKDQGPFYCSVGANAIYREVAEKHMNMCLKAGLHVSGINAEVAPCQWEYQIGPCEGIKSGDEMWISRWILERVSEEFDVRIIWDPKPFPNLNGSGCHTNFSTETMRQEGGLEEIFKAIEKLRRSHNGHMAVYGTGNQKRMSGKYETAEYDKFTFNRDKPVDRGASVRVGYDTIKNKCGYFEDRRPASSMDPYLVTSKIFRTCCLG